MMNFIHSPRKQRGIGLLELMLSLAIISILLVMATRYWIVSNRSSQVNRAVAQLGALQGAINQWKTGNPSTPPTFTDLNNIGALSNMDYQNNAVTNPWGGSVTLSSNTDGSVTINMEQVPEAACNSLAVKYNADPNFSPAYPCGAGNHTVSYIIK